MLMCTPGHLVDIFLWGAFAGAACIIGVIVGVCSIVNWKMRKKK